MLWRPGRTYRFDAMYIFGASRHALVPRRSLPSGVGRGPHSAGSNR